jgi:hypothetical protein
MHQQAPHQTDSSPYRSERWLSEREPNTAMGVSVGGSAIPPDTTISAHNTPQPATTSVAPWSACVYGKEHVTMVTVEFSARSRGARGVPMPSRTDSVVRKMSSLPARFAHTPAGGVRKHALVWSLAHDTPVTR